MHDYKKNKPTTQCVHAGIDKYQFNAVVPPIFQTSTFAFDSTEQGADLFAGKQEGYIYTRMNNPTIKAMEDAIATLENGHKAIGMASGMAAVHLIFATELNAGDHVVCSEAVYGPTQGILRLLFKKYNIDFCFIDASDNQALENAMKPNTKLVFIETPGNPTLAISDLAFAAELAHKHNAKLAVDNTFCSPILQRPFDLGADIIMHSMTKFLNGHADVVGGVVVLKTEDDYINYRKHNNHIGGCIDPFNAFLVHRGLKTLALRMERHSENGYRIAKWLEIHPKISWVAYPFLPSHPQYEIAKKQMYGGSGLIACEVKGGQEAGSKLLNSMNIFTLAVSLGGVESLIQHPASMTHSGLSPEARIAAGISDGLIRISVGIEDAEELIEDLDRALAQI